MSRRAAVAVGLLAAACGGESAPATLATLAAADGSVQDSRGVAPDRWTPANLGARYGRGDGVRTGSAAWARLEMRVGGGVLRMGPEALVRFHGASDQLTRVALETGAATIETGSAESLVETAAGFARLWPRASVRLRREAGNTRLEVVVGTATIERRGDEALTLASGAAVNIASEGAVTPIAGDGSDGSDAGDAGDGSDANASSDADTGSDADAGAADTRAGLMLGGRRVTVEASPARADLAIAAGESATLHAPALPLRLALSSTGTCPTEAVVELRQGRSHRYFRSSNRVALALRAGVHTYRLLCAERGALRDVGVAGTLRVLRDAGHRRVRTRAPRNAIESDGRRYRLLYQNRKPTIEMSWPDAVAAPRYALVLAGKGGSERRFVTDEPRYVLRSGAIAEGDYRWWFETDDGAARSPATTLVLDFDNAAPAAQLERAGWDADALDVRGVATEGSQVTVNGETIPLDGHFRFESRLERPSDQDAIAIRIALPGGVVHYYVKRAPPR